MKLSIESPKAAAPHLLIGDPDFARGGAAGGLVDFECDVPLPRDLQVYGQTVRAKLVGRSDAPLIVALGGISGNRFVCKDADGSPGWWHPLVGAGCAIDPGRHRILGLDFAADASGETAPTTVAQARIVCAALDAIGIDQAEAIVGASYGGMVALALAQSFPDRVKKLVVISAGAEPHPAATAARELQRRIVALGLKSGTADEALSIARGIAMLTYRTSKEFAHRFPGGVSEPDSLCPSEPGKYLRARGEAFRSVMSPQRFLSLSASIDRHCVDAKRIDKPVLLIGAETDQLVTADQMRALAATLPGPVELHLFDSLYGHDMFLKEAEAVARLAGPFLDTAE